MKTTKETNELRQASLAELTKKLDETRKELIISRIQKVSQQLKNPLKVRVLRKKIARLLTVVHEKEKA
ncbi:50S ribosomal protein L29 [candidate division WOR-1 bacterium RIFOXYB2_FULL_48_7]|uniref:Large ribosomal subunit protein uL29 n=1 Tax=candidate division WOR-1 bacterium RIFOXYB2_FULL_48_7 TaxID=1802583 RepID=A0A1F4TP16_UNCSA|nr:MAG: 50S ribosomal protein L29 [candidate division WOR-1 bacterium RIFOXYB2_FULL_48_7]